MTTIRLAYGGPSEALATGLGPMTTVRLVGSNAVTNCPQRLSAFRADEYRAGDTRPALLVSYAYWKQFASQRARYAFRDYALDSGAYTVKNSGGTVDLGAFIAFCQERLATDPQCAEIFSLDVIGGDWRESERNCERLWAAGVPAIPTYHYGEPESVLLGLARQFPKLALGGLAGRNVSLSAKTRWVQECFARVWPHRIHGFGMTGEALLMTVPFDSVDASNWEQAPAAWGHYKSMGKPTKSPRGGAISLRAEVEWYLALERRVAARWARELAGVRAKATGKASSSLPAPRSGASR